MMLPPVQPPPPSFVETLMGYANWFLWLFGLGIIVWILIWAPLTCFAGISYLQSHSDESKKRLVFRLRLLGGGLVAVAIFVLLYVGMTILTIVTYSQYF
jgi:hypothetical protein